MVTIHFQCSNWWTTIPMSITMPAHLCIVCQTPKSIPRMVGVVLLGWAAFCASLGLLLGVLARTEGQAVGLGVLFANGLAALGGCWWPIEVTSPGMQALAGWLPTGWAMDAMHQLISYRAGPASAVGGLLLLLAAAVPMNVTADEYVKYFDESLEFRADSDYTIANLTGINAFQMSIDSVRQKKKFFWDQSKHAYRHWLATNMSSEAFLGFTAFNTRKITDRDTIDFIKYRQLLAEGKRVDEELFEAVLGKPK